MIALYGFGSVYALWLWYLAVMALKRARNDGKLTLPAKILGYPILFSGLLMDASVNVTVMTVLFVEPPREWLVTARLKRHIYHSTGWREALAAWLCHNLLDAFDTDGKHCD